MFVLAETINELSKEVTNIGLQIENAKWAFGLVIAVVVAYGLGSGLTLIKISKDQISKIESDLQEKFDEKFQSIPSSVHEEDLDDAIVLLDGWRSSKKEKHLYYFNYSNFDYYQLDMVIENDEYSNTNFNKIAVIPINLPIKPGIYPAYASDLEKWVNVTLNNNSELVLTSNLNQKHLKLHIKMSGTNVVETANEK